ncbi:hypothetical protein [Jiangella muralis]|nr:hypothetical protein [Jiangella muralis]
MKDDDDGGGIDLDQETVLDSRGNRITEAIGEEMVGHVLNAPEAGRR